MTCAHIVIQALGHEPEMVNDQNADQNLLTLEPVFNSSQQKITARVVVFNHEIDFAILTPITSEPSPDRVPPMVILEGDKLWEHPFRAFGFPEKKSTMAIG